MPDFNKLRDRVLSLLSSRKAPEPEETPQAEMEKIISLANSYDIIMRQPGWEDALKYMARNVNTELVEATGKKYEPSQQAVHVTRWDAKRELLDGLTGYVESVIRARDALSEKGEEDGRPGATRGS